MANVQAGRYAHLTLPARYGGATLPTISLIDLRNDKPPPKCFLAPALVDAVRQTLAANEQALLFLNRRGYAPLTLCRTCGHRMKCPNCTAWLVEHRAQARLICHYCGHVERLPECCPHCEAEHSFAPVGPGVERIAEEAAALFPTARIALMASDLMEVPGSLPETLRLIAAREVDLIVGTQIIAKGHHFPTLTLVGVVDADLGLSGGDLRAGERTYQLLQQVAGRAGRAAHPGRAMIQTFDPGHQVMQALLSGDRDRFLQVEMAERRQAEQPPFTRLAALIVSSDDAQAAERVATELGRITPHQGRELYTLGPAPAPLSLLRNRYRYRLLLKAPKTVSIQAVVREWLGRVTIPNDVRVQVDIDPYGFL
jgi:primosomal protein N' (replication factor Y)